MNWDEIFGTGDPLTPLQMAVRAFITFFIALAADPYWRYEDLWKENSI